MIRPMRLVPPVSIHAPREGCDPLERRRIAGQRVSIHAPREGCDLMLLEAVHGIVVSIHAPREGCDHHRHRPEHDLHEVSIHAPREGCDRV